jgi:hypothetical protein
MWRSVMYIFPPPPQTYMGCFQFASSNIAENTELSEMYKCKFDIHGSVHRKYIPIYIQQDATLRSLFVSGNCCTFRVLLLPAVSSR